MSSWHVSESGASESHLGWSILASCLLPSSNLPPRHSCECFTGWLTRHGVGSSSGGCNLEQMPHFCPQGLFELLAAKRLRLLRPPVGQFQRAQHLQTDFIGFPLKASNKVSQHIATNMSCLHIACCGPSTGHHQRTAWEAPKRLQTLACAVEIQSKFQYVTAKQPNTGSNQKAQQDHEDEANQKA